MVSIDALKSILPEESALFKTIQLLTRLPEREQERIHSRVDGYLSGYEFGTRAISTSATSTMAKNWDT